MELPKPPLNKQYCELIRIQLDVGKLPHNGNLVKSVDALEALLTLKSWRNKYKYNYCKIKSDSKLFSEIELIQYEVAELPAGEAFDISCLMLYDYINPFNIFRKWLYKREYKKWQKLMLWYRKSGVYK